MNDLYPSPYAVDQRGNRLARWQVDSDLVHRLLVCTSERVVDQLRSVLRWLGYTVTNGRPRGEEIAKWTHCLEIDRALVPTATEFFALMQEILVLTVSSCIDSALALDFYKTPQEGVDPVQWPNTASGELVHRMKYFKSDPPAAEAAFEELANRMATVLMRHPIYREATIVQVPGHDQSMVSWGERLAGSIAARTGQDLIPARARHPVRPESKNRESRADLIDEFILDDRVASRPVLIIDDTTGTGDTLKGMAVAARRAKATTIYGFVGARTMRT